MTQKTPYIPAFHFRWLTAYYDRFMAGLYPEQRFRSDLIAQAGLQRGQGVLDVGCGTGTLTLMIRKAAPDVHVAGLDVDADVLAIARAKSVDAGSAVQWEQGSAARLPFADGSFDRVFASLMLHHLTREDKRRALAEIYRVLKPGGELHVIDFGAPDGRAALLVSLAVRWFEEIRDNILGLLPEFLAEAGFAPVEETARYGTISGTLRAYRACKPKRS